MAWLWNEHRWMRSVVDSMVHDVTTSDSRSCHQARPMRLFCRKDAGCCRSVGLWMIETNNALPPQPLMRTEDVVQRSVSVVPRPNVTQSGRLAAQRDTWTQICFWSLGCKRKIKSSSPDVAKSVSISQWVFVMGTGTALLSVSIHFSNPAISLPAKHCDAVTFASKHRLYCGTKDTHTHPWSVIGPFLVSPRRQDGESCASEPTAPHCSGGSYRWCQVPPESLLPWAQQHQQQTPHLWDQSRWDRTGRGGTRVPAGWAEFVTGVVSAAAQSKLGESFRFVHVPPKVTSSQDETLHPSVWTPSHVTALVVFMSCLCTWWAWVSWEGSLLTSSCSQVVHSGQEHLHSGWFGWFVCCWRFLRCLLPLVPGVPSKTAKTCSMKPK